MDTSCYHDATRQDPAHSMMMATHDDRWVATGMGPLATVAHVLAANDCAPASDPRKVFNVKINSHSQPLQPSAFGFTPSTRAPGAFDTPHKAASAAGSENHFTRLPHAHISTTSSAAHKPYQALPPDISNDHLGGQPQYNLACSAGNTDQRLGNAASMAVVPSPESPLGSGAYFDPSAEGMPDLPAGSTIEAPDTDMNMAYDVPCAPASTTSTHHHAVSAVSTHSASLQHSAQAGLPASGPPTAFLSTAFGTLAMHEGPTPMDTGHAEEQILQNHMTHPSDPHLRISTSSRVQPEGSLAAFDGSTFGSRFSSASDLAWTSHSSSPASMFPNTTSQPPSRTHSGYTDIQQQYVSHAALTTPYTMANDPSQAGHAGGGYEGNEVNQGERALSPALDVEMLRSMGYKLGDLMDDGGYSLGKIAETRRMRLMAEGPKPRQNRTPPSPRSIMDHRFSGGTVSGGQSTHHSGRSRLSVEARAVGSAAAAAAGDSSLWSRPAPVSSPLDTHQYFLPRNLVSPPPPPPTSHAPCVTHDSFTDT